jgi:putative transcriptional regulator
MVFPHVFDWFIRFFSRHLFQSCNNFFNMNRIKEVMDDKGIKQTWLSEKLGKSYSQVNGYVQNRNQPRLEVLFEIAKILDVDVKELIGEQKKQQ